MTEVTSDLLRQKRDNFRVEIRRQQTEMILKQKRQKSTNTQTCQITDEIVSDWYKRLVNNDIETLNDIRIAVMSQSAEYNLSIIHKHEVYPLIIKIWIDCDLDYKLLYIILHLLANMHSYTIFDDLALLQNKAAINKMIQVLLMTTYQQIQQYIFFLLANLVAIDNGTKARTLADYGFCSIIKKMWLDKLIYLQAENLQEFSWFLSNFFTYKSGNIAGFTMSEVRDVLPIVLECIYQDTTKDTKIYCLTILTNIFQSKDEAFGILMKNSNFIQEMQQLERNSKDEDIQLKIVENLCAFGLADDTITSQLVMDYNILDYLLQIYIQPGRKNQKQFKKMILWCLSNICCNQDFKTLKKIIQHDLIKYIQFDADQTDLIKDILIVIRTLSFMEDADLLKFVLMNRSIADIIINQIKIKQSKNITLLCLKIIENFASRIGRYSQSDINMAIEVFNSKGFDQLLHQLEYDSDEDIVMEVLKINETFYL